MKKLPVLLNTPGRAVIAVGLIILAGEFLIMLLTESIRATFLKEVFLEKLAFEFLDPILLTFLVSPALFLLIFKPMRVQRVELERQLDDLRSFQRLSIGRELRLRELADEIAALRNPLADDLPITSSSPKVPHDVVAQQVATQSTDVSQRNALLFMLEDLESAHKKIEQAHKEWESALDVVDDSIFLHDKQFRVLRCNKAYQQRAGISFKKQIIGQPYYEIFPKIGAPLPCCLRAMDESEEEKEEVLSGVASYRSRCLSVYDEQGVYLYSMHILEDITGRKQQEERALLLNQRLQQLVETIQKLALARDLESIIGVACSAARNLIGSDGATFVLREGDQCFYADENAIQPLWKGQRFPMSACISGWAMLNRQPAVIEDIYADERIPASAYRPTFVKSLAMVPIRREDPLGAMGNYWAHTYLPTAEEVQLLQTLADATGIAMENVRLFEEQKQQLVELKQATNALRESEERYRDLVENSRDLICTHDLDGKLLSVNEAAVGLTGYSREALLRMTLVDLLVPAVRGSFAAYLTEIRTAGVAHGVMCIQTAGGEERLWEYNNSLRRGAVPMVRGMAQDVTERKRAEKALRESEQRYHQIIQTSMDGFWAVDTEGRILDVNDAYCRKSGYSRDELLAMRIADVEADENPEATARHIREVMTKGYDRFETRHRRKDGQLLDIEVSAVYRPDREDSHFFCFLRNITARKQMEAVLYEKERLLKSVETIAKVGGWEFDVRTGKGTWTEEVARIHGMDPAAETSREIGVGFYQGESRQKIEAAIREAIESGTSYDLELEMVTANGDCKWVRTICQPVKEGDTVVKLRGSFHDITRRKRAEQALRAAMFALTVAEERERREIAIGLHDDPGQLLAAANLKLSTLPHETDRAVLENTMQEARELIVQAQRSLRTLIFQVSPPVLFELGLVPALSWLAEEVNRIYGLTVSVHDDNVKPLGSTMRTLVFRAVRELVINAAKHARVKTVDVDVRCGDGQLIVSVTDYGVGFDANNIGNPSTVGGFGLLSIRERLGFVGGDIEIDSSPGDGTVATLSVPLSAEEAFPLHPRRAWETDAQLRFDWQVVPPPERGRLTREDPRTAG